MTNEFLDMNQEAMQLVESLKKLNSEVKEYKTSKEQLHDLNKTLSGFINETKKLTEQSSKIIENMSKLEPSKIDSKIRTLYEKMDSFEEIIEKGLQDLTDKTNEHSKLGISKIDSKIKSFEKIIKESLQDSNNKTNEQSKLGISKIDSKINELDKRMNSFEKMILQSTKSVNSIESSISNDLKNLSENIKENNTLINGKKFTIFGKR